MTYEYQCPSCHHDFEVIKSVARYRDPENCPRCQAPAEKRVSIPSGFINASVEHAQWNPAFGQVVKNRYHRAELAKRHNVIEVGNDYGGGETMAQTFDRDREAKRESRWEDV